MTDQPAAPILSERLQERLAEGGRVAVVVTFRGAAAAADLQALGLRRGPGPEQGSGTLAVDAVRALGTRTDVAGVDLGPEAPAAGSSTVVGELRRQPSVDARLVERFAVDPAEPQSVSVWFDVLPADLGALGLVEDLPVNPALGVLDAAQVAALARRPDVRRIEPEPEPHLS